MIPRCVIVAVFFSVPPALAGGNEPPPKEKLPAILTAKPLEPDAKDEEEHKLGKARYNEAVAAVTLYYRLAMLDPTPTRSLDPVFEMSQQLLRAGLELSETPKSKVTLLEGYLELTKWLEGNIDQSIKFGVGYKADLHRARYLRLDAEIQLLRARRDADKAKGK